MVHSYKRTSHQQSWTLEKLQEAIKKVRSGEMSGKAASEAYGVPRTILMRRLAKNQDQVKVRELSICYICNKIDVST